MSLRERLIAEIAETGPMPISAFMTRCLHDPLDGYYATRPRLGAEGDFITAPHVSQMFGELIGLWAANLWTQLGSPSPVRLVELGPGDGTLMRDVLRVARVLPDFVQACDVWLVETSGPLRAAQAARLAGRSATWAARLDDVPTGAPLIVIANEFLDCLPIDQFVRDGAGWTERLVGLDGEGELTFGLAPRRDMTAIEGSPGAIVELSAGLNAFAASMAERIAADTGAGLFVDYASSPPGDSLQALRGHVRECPLAHPGEADLTAHVDFGRFLAVAGEHGADTAPLVSQRDFLRSLGIEARAAALKAANPGRAETVERQLRRLIAPDQMGELFRVACLHSAGLAPPGFAA